MKMATDSELEKASMREKLRSEKVLQQTYQTINTDKKNVAMDIKKSQNEMKKRLRKIRDRQREIQRSKSVMEKPPETIEEFLKHNKTLGRSSERRPMTSPPSSLKSKISSFFTPKLDLSLDDNDDAAMDPSFFTDQQKSKIDLRPKTASLMRGRFASLRLSNPKGRIGPRSWEERYFDEDEITDRATVYMYLTNLRKKTEEEVFDCKIETKVGEFLGQSPEQITRRREYSRFLRQTEEPVSMVSKKARQSFNKFRSTKTTFHKVSSNVKENQTPNPVVKPNMSDVGSSNNRMRAFSALQRGVNRASADLSRTSSFRIRPMSTSVVSRV